MTAARRDGSTAEKFKLTIAEKVMLVGLIACGMVGLFVPLVGVGPFDSGRSHPSAMILSSSERKA